MASLTHTGKPKTVQFAMISVWLVAGLAVLGSAVESFVTLSGRTPLAFGGADPRVQLISLPQINQAQLREGAVGYLVDIPLWLRALCAAPALLYVALALVAAVLLTRILREISAGRPFTAPVRKNMMALSLILIGAGLLYGTLDAAAGRAVFEVASDFRTEDFPLGADYAVISTDAPRWPYFMMTSGVVGLALSSAFKAGGRLQEENDGLV
ncbi:DUF2975 domain-containing protein [Arthrobacter caoxuetaonis]|uniref:DUF2975 domain-containing protein n=1 Tax=Arthrobacter caoxuetaonis TaxID=2886935 RepID=UPI001D1417FC|nr:DUF2975 domain-containing protein [Arthrobacter caoxuetaonis]MCC3284001.1 DUF2975 domain-containing protein [Arthrobacter caoxuetaonis]